MPCKTNSAETEERPVEILDYLPPKVKPWEDRTTYVDWKRRGKRS